MSRRAASLTMLGILIACVIVRLHGLGTHSLWADEIMSLQMSTGWGAADVQQPTNTIHHPGIDLTATSTAKPTTAVFGILTEDTHPPLYFLTLRLWRYLFGDGDSVARGLSLLCSVLAIIFLYDAVNTLDGPWPALFAAGIMAIATPQIVFAQETRPYTMLSLFLVAAAAAMARIRVNGPTVQTYLALGFATLAALFTHYGAIPAAAGLFVYSLIDIKGRARQIAALTLVLPVALFLLLWGPTLWTQRGNFQTNLAWIADIQPGFGWHMLARIASLPLQFLVALQDPVSLGGCIGIVLYLPAALAIRRRTYLLWILPAAAMIGSVIASDLLQHRKGLEILRFTIAAAPMLYALLGACGNMISRAIPAIVLVGCAVGIPQAYDQYWKSDLRASVQFLDQQSSADDLLIIPYRSRQQDWHEAVRLSALSHYSIHPQRDTLALAQPASDSLRQQIAGYPKVWLLANGFDASVDDLIHGTRGMQRFGSPTVGMIIQLDLSGGKKTNSLTTQPSLPQ